MNVVAKKLMGVERAMVTTGVAEDQSLASSFNKAARQWEWWIDHRLLRWWESPSALEDDGLKAPARTVLDTAIQQSSTWRDNGVPAPSSVVPDGDGGITFEWRNGGFLSRVEILETLEVDLYIIRDGKLVQQHRLTD